MDRVEVRSLTGRLFHVAGRDTAWPCLERNLALPKLPDTQSHARPSEHLCVQLICASAWFYSIRASWSQHLMHAAAAWYAGWPVLGARAVAAGRDWHTILPPLVTLFLLNWMLTKQQSRVYQSHVI